MFAKKAQKSTNKSRVKRLINSKFRHNSEADNEEEQSPRITNETVIGSREEVLSGARKYIYPLSHSRHKIVIITVSLVVAAVIAFTTVVIVNLYKFQSTSAFMYQITKVLPLPVARIGGTFISYENYLFELRHYIHYFETQQGVDFTSEQGKAQLDEQKKKSIENVVNFAYIKKIAVEKNITVSGDEIEVQIDLLRNQNKLGNDDQVFEDVLRDFWGWSVGDFRRSIYQELLSNKVLKALDTATQERANQALAEINAGAAFADVVKKYSDDLATKDNGGAFGFLINRSNSDIPAQTIDALFNLPAGGVSAVIDIGYGLEIIKNLGLQGDEVEAARIFFAFPDISVYLNDYKDKQPAQIFIKVL
jgi:parvulin-like peptidyl-prolyl isomerase